MSTGERVGRPDVIDRAFLIAVAHAELFIVKMLAPYVTITSECPSEAGRRVGALISQTGLVQSVCASQGPGQVAFVGGHTVSLVAISLIFDLLWVWQSVRMRTGRASGRAGMAWLGAVELIHLVITSGSVQPASVSGILSITVGALALVSIVLTYLPSAQTHFRAAK